MGMNARYLRPRLAFKPRTLYFSNNASLGTVLSRTWGELGNWYTNSAATVQATALPRSVDSVTLTTDAKIYYTGLPAGSRPVVRSLTNSGVFLGEFRIPIYVRNSAVFVGGTLVDSQAFEAGGSITLSDDTQNIGLLRAPLVIFQQQTANFGTSQAALTKFQNYAYNDGTVTGNAEFYFEAQNANLVQGNAWFYEYSANLGNVTGTATFNDQSSNGGFAGFIVCNTTGTCP